MVYQKLRIKFTRKEVLKIFKWRTRRNVKKFEKMKNRNPEFKKEWNDYLDEIDKIMAYGEGNEFKT